MRPYAYACALLATALLAGCESMTTAPAELGTPPTLAVVEQRHERDIEDVLINDCTGEAFPTTIDLHEVFALTTTPSGTSHLKYHLNIHAQTEDPATGDVYVANQVVNESWNVTPGEAYSFQVKFVMVEKGSGKLVDLSWHIHVTVNADGTVTSEFDRFSLTGRDCAA